ncbi:hypothetical protein ABID22_002731 [Pontibacter aydingkolensis]|uniref:DUF4136 domain-containing protein n=1 Tax=Pontibacter aydingkolensis TaxID=1911536 RepID=A0ABS7CWU8_9BACT|nr:hypothetical protein [Pontibacter aydingkolensis]MBW7468309.1 hypothetical protein [Pontibacter aydingkolensis]
MIRYVFILLAILCFTCKEQKQSETIVTDDSEPVKHLVNRNVYFKKITFSILYGMSRDEFDKDIEILADNTFHYRLRERYMPTIKANYTGVLDSVSISKVYEIFDAIDFNKLKFPEDDAEDAPEVSIYFTMYNGELRMKGYLDEMIMQNIWNLMELIEAQEMKQSTNHKFRTAKDVLIPPPGVMYTEAELDSL